MDSYTWALIAVAVVAVLCMIWAFSRGRHPCPTALFTGLTGICVLLLLNVLSPFIGPTLKLNFYTCGASAVLGVPGVVGMLFLKFLFGL